MVKMEVHGADVTMEVDTGASVTIISTQTYGKVWPNNHKEKLRTCMGEELVVKGLTEVNISYQGQQKRWPLLAIEGNGPSLMSRDWLQHKCLDLQQYI